MSNDFRSLFYVCIKTYNPGSCLLISLFRYLSFEDTKQNVAPSRISPTPATISIVITPALNGLSNTKTDKRRISTPRTIIEPLPDTRNVSRSLPNAMSMKLWYMSQMPIMKGSTTSVTPGYTQRNMPRITSRTPPTMKYPFVVR